MATPSTPYPPSVPATARPTAPAVATGPAAATNGHSASMMIPAASAPRGHPAFTSPTGDMLWFSAPPADVVVARAGAMPSLEYLAYKRRQQEQRQLATAPTRPV
ncbi:hypothetical protein AMAG_20468 [Allomyces macrogynus ATCC 38327]|uniref:Uncharacterized protein n=1 Tax=Allomyces macrogynus (strain ATCC 38327) TaxID=578462 RepID=A0A0L0TAE5_ALLM3|nr:hypothetical protein AMAG_20468 [Allomyces macrogynus ATCC 38327]|eukprot:KNE71691.1 hypothetical protein AMAG_20468 [Allomyces macrogynus ATCC 38327]